MKRAARTPTRELPAEPTRPAPRRRRWLLMGALALLAAFGLWWRGSDFAQSAARRALARHQPEHAIGWLHWSTRYFGTTAETQLLLARAQRKLGDIAASQESLRLAVAQGIDERRLVREEILLRAQTGQLPDPEPYLSQLKAESVDEEAEIHESFATGLIICGRLEEALKILDAWQVCQPGDAQPYYLRGVMHRDVGWPAQAEAEFRKAVEREPQHAEAALELAILLMRSHRYEEAATWYVRAMTRTANDGKVRVGLAHCYRMLGDVAAAREVLQPLVTGLRPNLGALAELGRIELMEGNFEQALRLIDGARRNVPRNSELNYDYASTLAALGRHQEAASSFEFAIEARRSIRKIAELTELVKARPDDLAARCEIARLSYAYGDARAAAGWAQSVLARDSNNAAARDILAKMQSANRSPGLPAPGTSTKEKHPPIPANPG